MDIQTKRLMQQLRAVGELVTFHVPRINAGGCGVYSLAAHDRLVSLGWSVSIAKCKRNSWISTAEARRKLLDRCFDNTHQVLREWHEVGWSIGHCWLVIGTDFVHDATYTVTPDRVELMGTADEDYLTRDELHAMVDHPGGWNDSFNRCLIPDVRRLINTGITLRR